MELIQDWKTFQSVFYPGRRSSVLHANSASAPITVIVSGGNASATGASSVEVVVGAFAEGLDLTAWIGQPLSQVSEQIRHRELVKVSLQDVDHVIRESLPLPHFFQQVEFIQSELGRRHANERSKGVPVLRRPREHFLIEAFRGWWSKVSPSAFGIFVQLEKPRAGAGTESSDEQFLMIFRRRAIDVFYRPDLSSLPADRRRNPSEVVKVLSDKHLVPVQGLTASREDWELWARSPNPWSLAAAAIRKDRARLVPFRWRIAFLMATRAFIGL